jgi:hypothetical protein
MSTASASEARRKQAMEQIRQDAVGMAPEDDEVPKEAAVSASETKTETPPVRKNEDEVLMETFMILAKNTQVGAPESVATGILGHIQKSFIVDQLQDAKDIDKWNTTVVDGKSTSSDWLSILLQRRTPEYPWPGEKTFLPDKPFRMNMRFDQTDHTMSVEDMCNNQLNDKFAAVFDIDSSAWAAQFPTIKLGRKDAHVMITGIALESSCTKGLPFDCEVHVMTAADDSSTVRDWTKPRGEKIAGTFGTVENFVVSAGHEWRSHADAVIFGHDLEHICNPWISRFLTFNFQAFDRMLEEAKHPKLPEYVKIKVPAPKDFKQAEITWLQWFAFTFYRYLHFSTTRKIKDDSNSDPEFAKKAGTGIVQQVRDGSYQLFLSLAAFKKVLSKLREKVKAATILSKLNTVQLGLEFVGGQKTAKNLLERIERMKSMRDQIDRSPFVGPLSFTISLDYIAIPEHYPELERQTEELVGQKFVRYQLKPLPPMPALKAMPSEESAGQAAGKYGRHCARSSFRAAYRKRV